MNQAIQIPNLEKIDKIQIVLIHLVRINLYHLEILGVSSIRNSKELLNLSGNNLSFLDDKTKPEINKVSLKDDANDLQLQTKDS